MVRKEDSDRRTSYSKSICRRPNVLSR